VKPLNLLGLNLLDRGAKEVSMRLPGKCGAFLCWLGLAYGAMLSNIDAQAAYKAPEHHAEIEHLAREFGYEGGRAQPGEDSRETRKYLSIKGDAKFRENLNKRGYKLRDSIDDRMSGMQAIVLEDAKGKNYIVFRGTEPGEGGDLIADLDRQSDVGRKQFQKHKDTLASWSRRFPDALVTGHSLGGALGQRYVVEHPDKIREAVFFNPPGIEKRHAHRFAHTEVRPPVTLYVAKGKESVPDFISELGGQSHIPGRVVEAEITGDTFYSHSSDMFNSEGVSLVEIGYQNYQNRRVRNFKKVREDILGKGGYVDKSIDFVGEVAKKYFDVPVGEIPDFIKGEARFFLNNELMEGPGTATSKMVVAAEEAVLGTQKKEETVTPETPKVGKILITKETYDGPKLGEKETLSMGEVVAFQVDIEHLGRKDNPTQELFSWQLFGPDDQPIGGVSKRQQYVSTGQVEKAKCLKEASGPGCFRFRLDNMINGRHKVAFTHQNLSEPDKIAQGVVSFLVYQAIKMTDLVVDVSASGKTSHDTLLPDQAPHLFVYFEMGKGVETATVEIRVSDRDTGAVIDSHKLERKRKAGSTEQRVGIRLDPGVVKVGANATFDATITGPGGKMETGSRDFRVRAYALRLNVPRTLVAADGKPFSIGVPKQFKLPLDVDIDTENGLIIHHSKDRLGGTITGIADQNLVRTGLTVRVTDAAGRQATGRIAINVTPLPKPQVIAKPPPARVATVSPASKCQVPSRYRIPGKNGKMMHVKIDRKDGAIYTATLRPVSGKGYWAKGQAKFGRNCKVLRHGWYKIYTRTNKLWFEGEYSNDVEKWSRKVLKTKRANNPAVNNLTK